VILDDDDDDHGIRSGRDQEQRDVHANEQYAPDLGESHLRRRELGDQLLDDGRLVVLRPQLTAVVVPVRRVVEHFYGCPVNSGTTVGCVINGRVSSPYWKRIGTVKISPTLRGIPLSSERGLLNVYRAVSSLCSGGTNI